MASNSDTSMSALGMFYDAILSVGKQEGKKNGETAAPDFVAGKVSDALATSMVQLGSAIGANPAVFENVTNTVYGYVAEKTTIGKLNAKQVLPFDIAQLLPTITYNLGTTTLPNAYEKSMQGGYSSTIDAEAKIEFGNPNDAIIGDPKKIADAAAAAYWENIKKIRNVKFWAGVGESAQNAAHYWMMTSQEGIPNDIAATVVNARIPNNLTKNVQVGVIDDKNPFATAALNLNLDAKTVVEAKNKASLVAGSALSMYSGITDQKQRDEFTSYTQKDLFEEVRKEYNSRVAGKPGYNKAESFFDIFDQRDKNGNFLLVKSQKDLFNGPTSDGDVLQASFQAALAKAKSNALYSANLKSNIAAFESKVLNDTEFTGLIKTFGAATEKALPKKTFGPGKQPLSSISSASLADASLNITVPTDLTGIVQLGAAGLGASLRSKGKPRAANAIESAAARSPFFDGNMTVAEKIRYGLERNASLPPLNQIITPVMVIAGDAKGFQGLINGLGGWTGTGPLVAKYGVDVFQAFGQNNAKSFMLSKDDGSKANGLLKFAYGVDKVDNVLTGKTVKNYEAAVAQFAKPMFLVSENANSAQKLAYRIYVNHPVNAAKGLLNGEYHAHKLHMASGYGAMYRDKFVGGLFRSEDLGTMFAAGSANATFFKGKSFGSLFENVNSKESRQGIKALRDHLNNTWNTIKDKNSSEAKNIVRAHAVLSRLEKMNSPGNKWIIDKWQKFHKYAGLPAALQKKALEAFKKFMWKQTVKLATKIGAKAALEAAAAAFTAGTSLVFTRGYAIVNALTFGTLDKIVGGFIKLTFETVMLFVLVAITIVVFLSTIAVKSSVALRDFAQMGFIEQGVLLPPDPDYVPQYQSYQEPEPTGIPIDPVDIISIPGDKGIDVSHWDGDIDWVKAKSSGNVEFAFIKATEGTSFIDDKFKKNWAGAKAAGVPRSAYHFFLGDLSGRAQAQHYLNIVDKAGGGEDFQLAVDVEWPYKRDRASTSTAARNLKEMVDYIEQARGTKPFIYTSYYAWKDIVGNPSWAGDDYPLWVANYTTGKGPSILPVGWTKWVIWQYTDKGVIPGIPSAVDLDVKNDAK